MNQKIDLQTAINDIKTINEDYQGKEKSSPLLCERLKGLEMELLDQFYVLMNKPVVRKGTGKRKNRVMSKKNSDPQQIRT